MIFSRLAADPSIQHVRKRQSSQCCIHKSDLGNQVGKKPAFSPSVTAKYGLTLRHDGRFNISLSRGKASPHQDSDLPVGTPASINTVPAKIPAYTVFDLSSDWQISRTLRLLGGISNLTNKKYYNRVFQNGIEPGAGRTVYAGIATGF